MRTLLFTVAGLVAFGTGPASAAGYSWNDCAGVKNHAEDAARATAICSRAIYGELGAVTRDDVYALCRGAQLQVSEASDGLIAIAAAAKADDPVALSCKSEIQPFADRVGAAREFHIAYLGWFIQSDPLPAPFKLD